MNRKGNPKHGLRRHPSYKTWNNMMSRCNNPNSPSWKKYGARGIKICKRWHSVENFIEDMGIKPLGKSIDRVDSKLGYSKSNCRWATPIEQGNNTSRNVRLKHNGREMTLAEWSRDLGINRHTLKKRWRVGWSIEEILKP